MSVFYLKIELFPEIRFMLVYDLTDLAKICLAISSLLLQDPDFAEFLCRRE